MYHLLLHDSVKKWKNKKEHCQHWQCCPQQQAYSLVRKKAFSWKLDLLVKCLDSLDVFSAYDWTKQHLCLDLTVNLSLLLLISQMSVALLIWNETPMVAFVSPFCCWCEYIVSECQIKLLQLLVVIILCVDYFRFPCMNQNWHCMLPIRPSKNTGFSMKKRLFNHTALLLT